MIQQVNPHDHISDQRSALGEQLQPCSHEPLTGFYRTGCCHTGADDEGMHTVCIVATEAFLTFSKAIGNDLSTPHPQWNFPGVAPGDHWCLCALRWLEAYEHGQAPKVVLEATNEATLKVIDLDLLKQYAAH